MYQQYNNRSDPLSFALDQSTRVLRKWMKYQWIHFAFLCLLNMSSGMTGFYYVFGLADSPFRCRLPSGVWPNDNHYQLNNATHQQLLSTHLISSSKCEYVNRSLCTDFVFDQTVFGRTFTEEAQFVCSNAINKT